MMTEPCKRAAGGNRRQLPPGNEHHRGKQIIAENNSSREVSVAPAIAHSTSSPCLMKLLLRR
jgi:hypothetical protein